jgi:hypothetical protein
MEEVKASMEDEGAALKKKEAELMATLEADLERKKLEMEVRNVFKDHSGRSWRWRY